MTTEPRPLEDVMAAMDVVDTLRHQQDIAERELDGQGRRERLLERLRALYRGQGIEVPDQVLLEGIEALEKQRFQYKPVASSWRTRLAHLWVRRARWGKPVGFLTVLGTVFYAIYFATEVWPERSMRAALPDRVQNALLAIINTAKRPAVIEQATQSADQAKLAITRDQLAQALELTERLESTQEQLAQAYTVRVVSRANENSGIWRRPPNNPDGRNYYLIVEAVSDTHQVVELPILNEETNTLERRKTWGLRVDEETFYQIAADKRDDGIIQGNKVGEKQAGFLKPVFSIPTTGATITEW